MKNYLKKGMLALAGLCIIHACSKDDSEPETPQITNLSFTAEASGAGNEVTVTPTSTEGTSYSIDFGTSADDDVLTTAGPGVSYTYPEEDASYTIVVTASATGFLATNATKEVTVDYTEPDPSPAEGRWVVLHDAKAMGVGPSIADPVSWWSNSIADVITRGCLFDDVFVFSADGTFESKSGDKTWIEPGFGNDPEGCAATIAPWDGSTKGTWTLDEELKTLTIEGAGSYLGLFKLGETGELKTGSAADESITYSNVSFSEDGNTMTVYKIYDGTNFWRMKFAKEGTTGAVIVQTDTDGDGVIDAYDECPAVSGSSDNAGCPVLAAPEDDAATPTRDASTVVSIFSDAYTDITSTFAPAWGQSTTSTEETIAGNKVKKLVNFNFVGFDNLGGNATNRVSIADVTHVTFDYWTPNGTVLKIKLVDYGADGDYAGDLYQPIVTVTETATQETWTRVELKLSDFTTNNDGVNQPLTSDGKIGQLIFENDGSEGAGTETFYIDNIYFY
jgi:hypothetical protein